MAKTRGLTKDPRSGIYYLRRRIPEKLRPAFACGDFYKVSLGTADLREAERKFAIANGEYEAKLAAFRDALGHGAEHSLSPDEATMLVERDLTQRSRSGFASGGMTVALILMDLDKAVREMTGERLPTAQDMSPTDWIAARKRLLGSDDGDEFSDETLARIEAEHNARHAPPGTLWFEYQQRTSTRRWRPLLKPAVPALKRRLDLPEGDIPGIDEPLSQALADKLAEPEVRQQLPQAPSARRRNPRDRAQPDMKLGELLKRWKAARNPGPKAASAVETAVEYFVSLIGDIGIGEITSTDGFDFRDAVKILPNSMPRAHRSLSFANQVAIYAKRSDLPRIAPASVKKYLGGLQALLGFAFQEQLIPGNVLAGIKVEGYSKRSDRRPFSREELAHLFAAPLFTRPWSLPRSKSSVSDMTLRWLFLLALFTGARIEELGQVLLQDIRTEGDIWFIEVTDYIGADGGAETKSVKTDASIRMLPIHAQLIDLGFARHVTVLRGQGAIKLFPDLKPDALQVQTKEASRRAGRLIDEAVSKDPRLVFHSFRHFFKDACREADIPMDVHDQLTGHAPVNQGGRYGLGRAIILLAKHLRKLDFTFIDWVSIAEASND